MIPITSLQASRRPRTAPAREPFLNFAYGRIQTAPTPALTGTTFVLESGHGARFPTIPFNASIWPNAQPPDPATAEVLRVNAIVGDTFHVQRAQEGTTARAIVAGDQVSANVTAGYMNGIGLWHDLDVTDGSLFGLAPLEGGPIDTGIWTPPTTTPPSSYAWAGIGIGTIQVSFYLLNTALTTDQAAFTRVFALKLPTTALGQARGRQGALPSGITFIRHLADGADWRHSITWVAYEDPVIRFGSELTMTAGPYDMMGSFTIPCDWW